jgi:hypothetical protein
MERFCDKQKLNSESQIFHLHLYSPFLLMFVIIENFIMSNLCTYFSYVIFKMFLKDQQNRIKTIVKVEQSESS